MSKVFTGSKASLKLNGVKIAFASGVNINREDTLTDIDVLDQLEVAEHAETGHKVSFSVTVFKVDDNAALQLSLDPGNLDDILTRGEMEFEVYNRITGRNEYKITGVKSEGGSGSVDARGVWQGTWNFKGRKGQALQA